MDPFFRTAYFAPVIVAHNAGLTAAYLAALTAAAHNTA